MLSHIDDPKGLGVFTDFGGKASTIRTKREYNRYGGSYAQNEMGYSDDDIDTIFDGDPSAYWNID